MAADPTTGKARTELNVAILYVDRAASRLAHPGHARSLQRLSRELADLLATLVPGEDPPRPQRRGRACPFCREDP